MTTNHGVPFWRKIVFYSGYLCMAAGVVLLIRLLWRGPDALSWSGLRAAGFQGAASLGLLALGFFLRKIGIRGLAGSMVVLDPPGTRRDLEPWSRVAGGLAGAAISEIPEVREITGALAGDRPVKVRCAACGALSPEGDLFCRRCGGKL